MNDLISELVTSIDPQSVMVRIVEQVCIRMPPATGASISLTDGNGNLEVVATYGASASLQGRVVRVEETFQAYPLGSGKPEIVHDVDRSAHHCRRPRDRLATGDAELPVDPVEQWRSRDRHVVNRRAGALRVRCRAHRPCLGDHHIPRRSDQFELPSHPICGHSWVEFQLRTIRPAAARLRALPDVAERDERRGVIDELLADGEIGAVFQPILDLASRELVGFEGLCRIPGDSAMRPDEWMALAHRVDRGVALELKALRTVLDAAEGIPEKYVLAVNLSPRAVIDEQVQQVLKDRRAVSSSN